MARPEVTGRRGGDTADGAKRTNIEIDPLALTIRQFCDAHNISHAFFYLLQQRGEGPRLMKVGSRRLVSVEEAARWRAARTATQEHAV